MIKNCLAPSTLVQYNNQINRFRDFCVLRGLKFPPEFPCYIAEYLRHLAGHSTRPKSILTINVSAIKYLYHALDLPNPCDDNIRYLITALVKSQTEIPRTRVNILPKEPFNALFQSWPDNESLSVKRLRLKVITLLAFAFMLRPSDIAPKSIRSKDGIEERLIFSTDNVTFHENGDLELQFFGIKNDTHREGFCVRIPPVSDAKLDPVSSLRVYINRTESIRPPEHRPVFLTCKKPYTAIVASTVSKILEDAIYLAGLETSQYSAKCFRPTGATRAIEAGCDPDKARRIGRWKTPSVFFEHYVYDKTPMGYTDSVML